MKPYVLLSAGGKEYKLKIGVAAAIELEDDLNSDIVSGLSRLGEVRVCCKYLKASLKILESEADATEVLEGFLTEGNKIDDLQNKILEVMENSGYIKQEAIEQSKKLQAQLQAKQEELLSK